MTRPFAPGMTVWAQDALGIIVGMSVPQGYDWIWPHPAGVTLRFTHGPWIVEIDQQVRGFASDDLSFPEDRLKRRVLKGSEPTSRGVDREANP